MGRKAEAFVLPELGQKAAERLLPERLVGVRIAPARENHLGRTACGIDRQVDRLLHSVTSDGHAGCLLVDFFPDDSSAGQQSGGRPERRFGNVATERRLPVIIRPADAGHGDQAHQPEARPALPVGCGIGAGDPHYPVPGAHPDESARGGQYLVGPHRHVVRRLPGSEAEPAVHLDLGDSAERRKALQ